MARDAYPAWINGVFVRASLDSVASKYRGELATAAARDKAEWYELTGPDARISEDFGPESAQLPIDQFPWLPARFPFRGSNRLSIVRSNPDYVLVEGCLHLPMMHLDEQLHDWTGAPVLRVWSVAGPNPLLDMPVTIFPNSRGTSDGFVFFADNRPRTVERRTADGKSVFSQSGPVQPFETPSLYRRRQTAERFTREHLFQLMGRLGLDAEGIFLKRELDNPILFTCDHPGQSLSCYEAERQRYLAWCEAKAESSN